MSTQSEVENSQDPTDSNAPESGGAESESPASTTEATAEAASPELSLEEQLAQAKDEAAKLRDQLVRTAADFDNYRKRARRDVTDAERRVQEDLIRSLLPTFDNIERASAHAESATDVASITEGLQMVQRQFLDALGGLGIERVKSLGQPFDPAEHEAVQHVETSDVPVGAVAQELQAGYRWNGRLIRPAMVVVAKAPAS